MTPSMNSDTRQLIAWCHTSGTIRDLADGRLGGTIHDLADGRQDKTIDCSVKEAQDGAKGGIVGGLQLTLRFDGVRQDIST